MEIGAGIGSELSSRVGAGQLGTGLESGTGVGQGQGVGMVIGDGDGKGSYCSDDIFNRRDMW